MAIHHTVARAALQFGKHLPAPVKRWLRTPGGRAIRYVRHAQMASLEHQDFVAKRVANIIDTLFASGRALNDSNEYREYLRAQLLKTCAVSQAATGAHLRGSAARLIQELSAALPLGARNQLTVLCVGCRHTAELDAIEEICGTATTGLDLFSEDPRIMVGDMHQMPFTNHVFAGVYTCHSLEHAYDPNLVIREYCRVLKPGGVVVIEVPTHFSPGVVDRWDAQSTDNLIALFGQAVAKVTFREDIPSSGRPGSARAQVCLTVR